MLYFNCTVNAFLIKWEILTRTYNEIITYVTKIKINWNLLFTKDLILKTCIDPLISLIKMQYWQTKEQFLVQMSAERKREQNNNLLTTIWDLQISVHFRQSRCDHLMNISVGFFNDFLLSCIMLKKEKKNVNKSEHLYYIVLLKFDCDLTMSFIILFKSTFLLCSKFCRTICLFQ